MLVVLERLTFAGFGVLGFGWTFATIRAGRYQGRRGPISKEDTPIGFWSVMCLCGAFSVGMLVAALMAN